MPWPQVSDVAGAWGGMSWAQKVAACVFSAAACAKAAVAARDCRTRRRAAASGHEVIIIGAGYSCLALALKLKELGVPFRIFERQSGFGGCWRKNTYPGLACDTPVLLYSLWSRQSASWSKKWAGQEEILRYQEAVARADGLNAHAQFEAEVTRCEWDARRQRWAVGWRCLRTGAERTAVGSVVVAATGLLAKEKVPAFPGLSSYSGKIIHTASWDPSVELAGKKVACIGTGASAIGLIPPCVDRVAEKAGGRFTVFQRSAAWIIPKDNAQYGLWHRLLFRFVPFAQKLLRWQLYWEREVNWPAFADPDHPRQAVLKKFFKQGMASQVKDPELLDRVTPKLADGSEAPVGALRMLTSQSYLPALQKPHVTLCTSAIAEFVPQGIVTQDGELHELDVVIAATGFDATQFTLPMRVSGRDGRLLTAEWGGSPDGRGVVAKAYLGMTVHGFPNFFMMYGPNTNLGHNSVLVQIESQSRYIASCVRQMVDRDIRVVEITRPSMMAFCDAMAARLRHSVWELAGSWYRGSGCGSAEGINVCNWMGESGSSWFGGTLEYIARTYHCNLGVYRCERRGDVEPARAAAAERAQSQRPDLPHAP
eukprot:TRINITY_DN3116_c0_g1_i1.p1 TRINITY_DN3116_c0_g1~~TRINITY_DN3116_c0_g1_i1.p1  ORF type:complete len:620 (+),score=186.15 TRINITY_DN3116_c0_g1_i1:77-1861(+)